MRFYTFLFIQLLFVISTNAQNVKKTSLPNWVTPITYEEEKNPNNSYIRNVSIPRLNRFKENYGDYLKENAH